MSKVKKVTVTVEFQFNGVVDTDALMDDVFGPRGMAVLMQETGATCVTALDANETEEQPQRATMKTSELTGPALDWAVAKAADYLHRQGDHWMVALPYVSARMNFVPNSPRSVFSPSTRWAQGGPIIEREGIELLCESLGFRWVAAPQMGPEWRGPTPLVAAMRCYVASKLGYEIEVPEELNPTA